jgi:hypothetical protein
MFLCWRPAAEGGLGARAARQQGGHGLAQQPYIQQGLDEIGITPGLARAVLPNSPHRP